MSLGAANARTSVLTDTYVGQLERELGYDESNPLLRLEGRNRSPTRGCIHHQSLTVWEIFTSRVSRLWSRLVHCKYSKRKIPTDKPVLVLLILCFLQRLAFLALTLTLQTMHQALGVRSTDFFLTSFIEHCLACLIFPVAGWAGDVYLGRVKAIHVSLLLLFFGYGALTLECALYYHYNCTSKECLYVGVVMVATYLTTAVGDALFQANMVPYGADLIMYECSSTQVSSYFYWYYWVYNLGGPVFLLRALCGVGVSRPIVSLISSAIAVLSLTIAVMFFVAMRSYLPDEKIKANPYKTSIKILFDAARAKRPKSKSAFGFGKPPPPRIDLAKWRHGGKFDNEQVEDVKTIWRLSFFLVAINTSGIALVTTLDVTMLQSSHFKVSFLDHYCDLHEEWVWLVNITCIVIVIPLLELVIFPILGEFTPSMLKMIGVNFLLLIVSSFSQLLIETVAHLNHGGISHVQCMFSENITNGSDTSPAVLTLPILLASIAEVIRVIPGLTFVYAQSPCHMRGMMTGLFFFLNGMFSFAGYGIMQLFTIHKIISKLSLSLSCGFWYFVTVTTISCVLFAIYTVMSLRYKNRDRGELESKEPYYFRYRPVFLRQWRES